jgi:iron complex outermembrane recepter protein
MSSMLSRRLGALLAGAAGSAVLIAVAQAQAPAAAPAAVPEAAPAPEATGEEEVVVTATRGRPRSVLSSPVPIDVISADAIQKAGAQGGQLGLALQSTVPSFNFPIQSNSGAADNVRPAQIRNLGSDQTLVLINGKRRHTTAVIDTTGNSRVGGGTAPVDFNAIPSNAFKRIEVLRDGAGAQYGSDAIAGVVNVILKDAPAGTDVSATVGTQYTNFEPTDEWKTDGQTYILQADTGIALGNGGFLRVGAEYQKRRQTDRGAVGQVPFFESALNVPVTSGRVNFKPGDGGFEAISLWANAGVPISESVEAYAFVLYSRRESEGTGFFRYPFSSDNVAPNPFPGGPLPVFPLGFRPISEMTSQDLGITGGLKGSFGAWNWDASLSYGLNDVETGVRNTVNPSLGPTSPTAFFTGSARNSLFAINVDLSREFTLGSMPATFAAGIEYRGQSYKTGAGEPLSYQAGPFAGPPTSRAIGARAGTGRLPADTRDLSRDVYSLYAELSVDVTDTLFVDVAARYENSDDYGDSIAGKFAFRWEFVENVALRGAISNSFKAPALQQLGFSTSSTNFGAGGQLTTVNIISPDDPIAVALGSRGLEAEESVNYSVGFTGSNDWFSISVDAFQIDIDGRINLSSRLARVNMNAAAQALALARNITSAQFFTNAIDTSTRGIEGVITAKTDLFGGKLDLTGAVAYARTDIRNVRPLGNLIVIEQEDIAAIEGAIPKTRISLTGDWTSGKVSVLGRVTRYGEATRVFNFGSETSPFLVRQTYGQEYSVDLEVGYKVFGESEVFVGSTNLFDAYPDRSSADISYFGNLPYDVLSPIGMNGRYIYGGFRASF